MCCWDPRAPSCSGPVARSELPGRAYGLAATPSHVIVATSGRHVCIYSTDRCELCAAHAVAHMRIRMHVHHTTHRCMETG
jgi:hypothetical protein